MPFLQGLLFHVPVVALGFMAVLLSVALSAIGVFICRKILPRHISKSHNELIVAVFGAIALAYTVLLAFVVVVSWQNFDKAKTHTEMEANCLVSLHRASSAFPEEFRDRLRPLIKDYTQVVVNEEWPMLARGQESLKARGILRKIWEVYTSYEPKTEKEKLFFAESLRKLDDMRELRRMRIIDSRSAIASILWFVLIFGGLTTVGLTLFLWSESFTTHVVMASLLAALIAVILVTIASFNFPFTGSVSIGPETFQEVIHF